MGARQATPVAVGANFYSPLCNRADHDKTTDSGGSARPFHDGDRLGGRAQHPLQDLDGRARNVNEFIGHDKWVIVVTWSHDCHICDLEIHEMAALHAARHDNDAIVLGITLDGAEYLKEARAFVKRHKLPFVNLITEPSRK